MCYPGGMRYSQPFDDLWVAATRDGMNAKVQYQRVAGFVSKFHLTISDARKFDKPGFHGTWKKHVDTADYRAQRQWVIDRVVRLTQREWDLVRDYMQALAESSMASIDWRQNRFAWVRELDMLYTFEHPE